MCFIFPSLGITEELKVVFLSEVICRAWRKYFNSCFMSFYGKNFWSEKFPRSSIYFLHLWHIFSFHTNRFGCLASFKDNVSSGRYLDIKSNTLEKQIKSPDNVMKEKQNHPQCHDPESTILTYFLTLFVYFHSFIISSFISNNKYSLSIYYIDCAYIWFNFFRIIIFIVVGIISVSPPRLLNSRTILLIKYHIVATCQSLNIWN